MNPRLNRQVIPVASGSVAPRSKCALDGAKRILHGAKRERKWSWENFPLDLAQKALSRWSWPYHAMGLGNHFVTVANVSSTWFPRAASPLLPSWTADLEGRAAQGEKGPWPQGGRVPAGVFSTALFRRHSEGPSPSLPAQPSLWLRHPRLLPHRICLERCDPEPRAPWG